MNICNIELMLNAIQIKIISRFVAQIMKFKKILEMIMHELKVENSESISILSKKKSKDMIQKNGNIDLFSSIMMNLNADNSNDIYIRESKDIFKSIVDNK